MKCVHVLVSSGSDDDLVSSYPDQQPSFFQLRIIRHTLTSVVDMFPTTLLWLSTTATDDIPSVCINCSASQSILSPLHKLAANTNNQFPRLT